MTRDSRSGPLLRGLLEAVDAHERWRGSETLNLIASEGCPSPAVEELYCRSKDLWHRYAEGPNDIHGAPAMRFYQGQRFITPIEAAAAEAMRGLFGATFVDVRPVSGVVANLAAFRGLSRAAANPRMVVAPVHYGAHITHDQGGLAGQVLGLETADHAFDVEAMNIDADRSAAIIRKVRPGIVTFGGSLFLFPHPVAELAEVAREVGAFVLYDAAHVLGLIAGKRFQDPLREGADLVSASTHKTFPGPQGGVVLGGFGAHDERLRKAAKRVQSAVFPLSVSNHHLRRLPALALAALEMREFGEPLAERTVANARHAGKYLCERGVDVLGSAHGFTRSHQLALDVRRFGGGRAVAEAMERANIVLNMNLLPWDDPRRVGDPSGVRIGFQEVTRRGFEAGDVEELCELVLDVLLRRSDPSEVAPKATALRARFPTVRYGFSSVEEALSKLGG